MDIINTKEEPKMTHPKVIYRRYPIPWGYDQRITLLAEDEIEPHSKADIVKRVIGLGLDILEDEARKRRTKRDFLGEM